MYTPSAVILLQINPRLDGCIRAWNLMNQGHSGVKEVIQEKQSKHCLVTVERGSFYPGTGMAQFDINYSKYFSVCSYTFCWTVDGGDELEKKGKRKEKQHYVSLHLIVIPVIFFEKYV